MQIINYPFSENNPEKPITCCIGFFDGVHRGHRFLLEQLKSEAAKNNTSSAVITFRNHPAKFINPDNDIKLLTSFDEKMSLIAAEDIDYCFVLDFNEEIKNLEAEDFIKNVLKEKINAGTLLIGYDHRFGKNRNEGFYDYVRYGQECGLNVIKEPGYSPEGTHISSSEVRRKLNKGDVKTASDLLSYNYGFNGKVVEGHKIGRTLGFPTANLILTDKDKIIPADGVYIVSVKWDNVSHYGILNIGNRPTIHSNGSKTIEVHILDFKGEIYDKNVNVEFLQFIREEKKFDSYEELQKQINEDKIFAINYITSL